MEARIVRDQSRVIELEKFIIGLNYGCRDSIKGRPCDCDYEIDLAAFMIGSNKKMLSNESLVFYNNPKSPDQSVECLDILTFVCTENQDDEIISVDLTKIHSEVQEIIFTISIYEAKEHGIRFGNIKDLCLRIHKDVFGETIYRYDISEDISEYASVEVCRLYQYNDKWMVQALGIGHHGGLEELISKFT